VRILGKLSFSTVFFRPLWFLQGDLCWRHCLHFCSFAYGFTCRRKHWLQEVKELVKLNVCWNIWFFLCNIQGEIVFQILQNLWVAKVLMGLYIFCRILSFLNKTCVVKKVFNTSGSYSLAELIMLWAFNIQNWFFCSSIRNWIAYANEANIVNNDSPIATKVFNYDTQQYEAISLVKEGELPLLKTAKWTDWQWYWCIYVGLLIKWRILSEAWHDLALNCKDIESRRTEKKSAKNGVLDRATTIYINISDG